MAKTLGDRIRELRETKDVSLRAFARKLDVSAAFVSDIELGRRNPSDDVLIRMARLLGTTADDLRSYDARPPVDELRRLAAADPAYGVAFRRIVEEGKSPEEIMKWLQKREDPKHEKKK